MPTLRSNTRLFHTLVAALDAAGVRTVSLRALAAYAGLLETFLARTGNARSAGNVGVSSCTWHFGSLEPTERFREEVKLAVRDQTLSWTDAWEASCTIRQGAVDAPEQTDAFQHLVVTARMFQD